MCLVQKATITELLPRQSICKLQRVAYDDERHLPSFGSSSLFFCLDASIRLAVLSLVAANETGRRKHF